MGALSAMPTMNFFVACNEVYRSLFGWVAREGRPKALASYLLSSCILNKILVA